MGRWGEDSVQNTGLRRMNTIEKAVGIAFAFAISACGVAVLVISAIALKESGML